MSAMSCSRDAATNACSVKSAPATKREFFQLSKYSLIVGTMIVSAVNASEGVAENSAASESRDFACSSNSRTAET